MIWKKVSAKLNQTPRRNRNILSNLIAGVISAGLIATLLGIIQKHENMTWITPNFFQIFIIILAFVVFYFIGRNQFLRLKNKEELCNYNYNALSGLISSTLLAILLNVSPFWIRPIVALILALIVILILYLTSGRRKRR